MLREIPLPELNGQMPEQVQLFAAEGLRRAKRIDCFDFVPSQAEAVYRALAALPAQGRFCEWGAGIGINTGIAALLGYEAYGIEIHPQLASAARQLLADFQIQADIATGDYFVLSRPADVYFTYCWPGQMARVEEHFAQFAPPEARLLICHGAEDIRCKVAGVRSP